MMPAVTRQLFEGHQPPFAYGIADRAPFPYPKRLGVLVKLAKRLFRPHGCVGLPSQNGLKELTKPVRDQNTVHPFQPINTLLENWASTRNGPLDQSTRTGTLCVKLGVH